MPLSDELIVYPGHGAGSACGKKMSSETTGTLGEQKKSNYALRENMTKEEFISEVNEGLLPPPAYFPYNVSLNKTGYQNIEKLIEKGINTLCPIEFEMTSEIRNCVILDVRHQTEFAERHIPGSIFIGIDGSFAPWVGSVLKDINQPILLVANEERIEETVIRLSRVGFDNVVGVLCNDLDDWVNSGRDIESVNSESPSDWVEAFENSEVNVIDVRNESEHQSEHILNSINIPLNELTDRIDEIDFSKKTLIHCAGGYRSMIACSLLKYKGHHDLIDIKGGYATIKETKFPKSNFSCPSTLTN
jgi:rhodanese-related sulfurtransferase